jgi:hypothetical protein
MKAITGFLLLFLWVLNSLAQQYDAQWVIGPNISVLNFQNIDTVQLDSIPNSNMAIFLTSASISNASGNLLYFTNGIFISDKNGDTLPNGYGLSPCPYTDSWSVPGLNIPQAALFIPKPGDSTEYYLIHFSNDTLGSALPGTLYYTQVKDSGSGYVIKKNIPFGKGIFRQGGMTACKHANGRDYWVVMGLNNSNEYFTYLFTPDSVLGPFIQDIGAYYGLPYDLPYSKFSQDGCKYATGAHEGLVTVMDFDRCSGVFSNPETIFNNASLDTAIDTLTGSCAVEFSPNGRFLYVGNVININQYDLGTSSIQDSVALYNASDSDVFLEGYLQLAPNGKLYVSTWNGGANFIHVINYPDEIGDSCDFVYGGQPTLSINSFNFPNLINYKLGPLIGSGCDTIPVDTPSALQSVAAYNNLLRVLPNPADKYLYVEMGTPASEQSGRQGNYEFQLLNEMGQLIDKRETRQIDIFDTERLASGTYFIKAIDRNRSDFNITKKVVVSH